MAGKIEFKGVEGINVQQQDLSLATALDHTTLDPNFVYRWAHASPLKTSRLRAKGYVFVDPAEEPGIKLDLGDAPEISEGGLFKVADVVLMKIRKTRHRSRRLDVRRTTKARLKGPVKKFKSAAKAKRTRSGQVVKVITDEVD